MLDIKRGTAVQPVELPFKITTDSGLVLDAQDHQPMVVKDSGTPPLDFFELPKQDKERSLLILASHHSVSFVKRRLRS